MRSFSLRLFMALSIWLSTGILTGTSLAGPPFRTDDPEPVEYKHGELYFATQYSHSRDGNSGTFPQIEANYGIFPDAMLHLIVPFQYENPIGGKSHYGYGDTEIGIKYRIFQEEETVPMVGIFPLLEIPTGNHNEGLGTGRVQGFLPLWIQKSWGPWTSYGGGGYWINPGEGNKNWWFLGWLIQRNLKKKLTLGVELF